MSDPNGGWASPGWQPPDGGLPPQPQQPGTPPPPPHGGPPQPPAPQNLPAPATQGLPPQQPFYGPGWQAPVPPPAGRMGRERRKVALLVIGGVVAVVVVVGVVAAARYWLASRPLGEVTRAQTVAAGRLATGHCLGDLPRDGAVGSVRVVPCAEPHTAEVVGELPLSGTSWPGAERVQDQAAAWCEMDASQAELDLRAVVWTPTEASWAQGDRTALCLAWNPSGTMTGSFTSGDPVTTG